MVVTVESELVLPAVAELIVADVYKLPDSSVWTAMLDALWLDAGTKAIFPAASFPAPYETNPTATPDVTVLESDVVKVIMFVATAVTAQVPLSSA